MGGDPNITPQLVGGKRQRVHSLHTRMLQHTSALAYGRAGGKHVVEEDHVGRYHRPIRPSSPAGFVGRAAAHPSSRLWLHPDGSGKVSASAAKIQCLLLVSRATPEGIPHRNAVQSVEPAGQMRGLVPAALSPTPGACGNRHHGWYPGAEAIPQRLQQVHRERSRKTSSSSELVGYEKLFGHAFVGKHRPMLIVVERALTTADTRVVLGNQWNAAASAAGP